MKNRKGSVALRVIAIVAVLVLGYIIVATLAKTGIPFVKKKVAIVAYYPFDKDRAFIKDTLDKLQGKYKDQIVIKFVNINFPIGKLEWEKNGPKAGKMPVAGLVINGKNKFYVSRPNGEYKEVELTRWTEEWTEADLESTIKTEYERINVSKKGIIIP